MAYEQKPGFGAIFANEKRSDNAPDRRGTITAHRDIKAGEELEIAGWLKKDRNGNTYLSLKMGDKRQKNDRPVADNTSIGRDTAPRRNYDTGSGGNHLDDEIPF